MKDDSSGKPVVFVVDDDPLVRGSVSSLLRSVGLQTRVFASTSEFLQEKRPPHPSCLVLDVRLPGVSGLDFQAELSSRNIHIPVIFMTGHGDIPMTVRAMKAGALEFLTKPFREQDMLDAVKLALERDQSRLESEKASSGLKSSFKTLTPREQEIMALVASGLMNKQVPARSGSARSRSRFIGAASCIRWEPGRWRIWSGWPKPWASALRRRSITIPTYNYQERCISQ